MINGIILVLGNKPKEVKAEYIRGLSLFFAAFIALGFDSFLFGLVTGESTKVIDNSACRRAWTEAMLGAGLLAVGTVAIIAGFIYLFTAYFKNADSRQDQANNTELQKAEEMLETLCNLVRGGVAIAVVTTLYMTSRSYLYAINGGSIPSWGNPLLWEIGVYGVFVLVFTVAAVFHNRLTHKVIASSGDKLSKALKWGIYLSVLYTVISAVAAAAVAISSASFWYPVHVAVRLIIASTLLWVSLGPLIPLWLLLGRAVPPFGQPELQDRPAKPAPADVSGSLDPPHDTGTAVSPPPSTAWTKV